MLVENAYPQDTRVRNEASCLVSAGCQVSVICLRRPGQRRFELVNGVRVYRLPRLDLFKKTPATKSSFMQTLLLRIKSFAGYLAEYVYFTTACLMLSAWILVRHGFDVLHAHNPPDTLFLAALPFKLVGKKFVFDHHDLSPELYRSRYGAPEGLQTRILRVFEWCSLKLADITIATNHSYKEIEIARAGIKAEKIFVVRNGPSGGRMTPMPPSARLKNLNKTILCYIGSLNPQDGVDYLLRSLHHLKHVLKRDDFYCVIMGSGDSLGDLRALAHDLRLDDCIELTGFVSDEELGAGLAAADICVDPDPSSPLNDASTWIKVMEYMAYGKPIVTYDLKETRFSAQNAAVYVEPNKEEAFAEAIIKLMGDPQQRMEMGRFGRARVERELQWSVVSRELLRAYETLFAARSPARTPAAGRAGFSPVSKRAAVDQDGAASKTDAP